MSIRIMMFSIDSPLHTATFSSCCLNKFTSDIQVVKFSFTIYLRILRFIFVKLDLLFLNEYCVASPRRRSQLRPSWHVPLLSSLVAV